VAIVLSASHCTTGFGIQDSGFRKKQGTGNREQGIGNREQGIGNREKAVGDRAAQQFVKRGLLGFRKQV
jgi:hypothetical protein